MRIRIHGLLGIALLVALAACSLPRHMPHPMSERNGSAVAFDAAVASGDLRACQAEVREGAPVSIQPRWIPPLGTTVNGVVLGTVDVPHPGWPSREAYRQAIDRCLTGRGSTVHGIQ